MAGFHNPFKTKSFGDLLWLALLPKDKVFPYSFPSVGPGIDHGVGLQAVSRQVTLSHPPDGSVLFCSSAVLDVMRGLATPRTYFLQLSLSFAILIGGIGCQYFPPRPKLPSKSNSVAANQPVPNYTAW